MSGVLADLGLSSGGTTRASSGIQLPDWVNQAALQNYQTAMGLSQQPYVAYPGQMIAGFQPAQTQAFNAVQNLPSTAPTFQTALGNVQNLPQTTQSLLNPYLGNVEADTVSNIQRAAALQGQQIAAQAQQGGAYGGTRYGVERGILDSETQRNIGQAVNQIQSQGWNTASQTALNQAQMMAGLATSGQQAALQGAGAQMQVGATQQQQQQAQLAQQLAQWQQQQNWPYQQLAVAQGALAGSPYGTTTTSSQPYTSNPVTGAASYLSALPALGGLVNQVGQMTGLWGGNTVTPPDYSQAFTNPGAMTGSTTSTTGIDLSALDPSNWLGNAASSVGSGATNFISDAGSTGAGFLSNSWF